MKTFIILSGSGSARGSATSQAIGGGRTGSPAAGTA